MEIKEGDFKKIMEYTRDELLKQVVPATYENGYGSDVVGKAIILSLPSLLRLDDFLKSINEKKEKAKPKVDFDNGFDAWWMAYPGSANFVHRGMSFQSGKALRVNKEDCYRKYKQILHENPQVTPDMMLNALKKQVQAVKDESYHTGKNALQYFGLSTSYLNAGKYEAFLSDEVETTTSQDGGRSNEQENCG